MPFDPIHPPAVLEQPIDRCLHAPHGIVLRSTKGLTKVTRGTRVPSFGAEPHTTHLYAGATRLHEGWFAAWRVGFLARNRDTSETSFPHEYATLLHETRISLHCSTEQEKYLSPKCCTARWALGARKHACTTGSSGWALGAMPLLSNNATNRLHTRTSKGRVSFP